MDELEWVDEKKCTNREWLEGWIRSRLKDYGKMKYAGKQW